MDGQRMRLTGSDEKPNEQYHANSEEHHHHNWDALLLKMGFKNWKILGVKNRPTSL
jgi:hypothetical protein